jgi:hypothetical protein
MINEKELPNLEDFLAMSQAFGMTKRPIKDFVIEHPDIAEDLRAYDPVKLAATIGGLLTKPELQSNCYRLEVLLHMTLICARGRKKPDKPSIIRWFNRLEHGMCGRWEDPAEDVFVSSIETRNGNYRVLEGIWEANGFYLQRVVNVIDNMPDGPGYSDIKQSVHALLKLSDLICERAGLSRYQTGNEIPRETLPANLLSSLAPYGVVRFFESKIIEENIDPSDLRPFYFQPDAAKNIPQESLGHTSAERFPIIYDNKCLYLS